MIILVMMIIMMMIMTTVSNLKDHEVRRRVLGIAKAAQKMCIAKWNEYHIRDTSQLIYVHELVFTTSFMVLKQADQASIQELLKGTVQENRIIQPQSRESMLDKIRRAIG